MTLPWWFHACLADSAKHWPDKELQLVYYDVWILFISDTQLDFRKVCFKCAYCSHCTEFQKRVLYQLALLSKEVGDIRRLLERQPAAAAAAAAYNSEDLPDMEVSRGPLEQLQAVNDLSEKCEEADVRQFLVCRLC